jgi:hypothetical protein
LFQRKREELGTDGEAGYFNAFEGEVRHGFVEAYERAVCQVCHPAISHAGHGIGLHQDDWRPAERGGQHNGRGGVSAHAEDAGGVTILQDAAGIPDAAR